jgi:hypothetical protein
VLYSAYGHEGVWGSGGVTTRILNLGTRWKWVVSFTSRPLYPWRSPWCRLIGSWVDPWWWQRNKCPSLRPGRSARTWHFVCGSGTRLILLWISLRRRRFIDHIHVTVQMLRNTKHDHSWRAFRPVAEFSGCTPVTNEDHNTTDGQQMCNTSGLPSTYIFGCLTTLYHLRIIARMVSLLRD